MLFFILVLLILFWLAGYISFPFFNIFHRALFYVSRHPVTLWDLLLFAIMIWILQILPSTLRTVGVFLLILWFLSFLGVITFTGLFSFLIAVFLIAVILYLLGIHF